MKNNELKQIKKENWKRINDLIEIRIQQVKDIAQEKWWEVLIEDEHYNFLIKKLVEIKQMGTQPDFKVKVSEKDIKNLASGFVSVEEFVNKS